MPELPEVEVLARHLRPLLRGKTIRAIEIRRGKVLQPTSPARFKGKLRGAKFLNLERRGKYLLFELRQKDSREKIYLLGHLGMTGKMFLAPKKAAPPRHAAVVLDLGANNFIYEDTRYFGRLTLDVSAAEKLGPEPWDKKFTAEVFRRQLKKSRQPVKVKLLDQSLIAGVGNIYAGEALFRAGISPRRASNKISGLEAKELLSAVRKILTDAIACGSTIPLNFAAGKTDGLFYFGRAAGTADHYGERLRVYGRAGKPCLKCGSPIKRMVQAARSTFFCPRCQKA
ncbi:MAG TPA: bifunctional DNA-formamidopyrimidine glycosylase/DNA-(apurinic or apyrimidinic site) lyase [Verrucomicrobiae bacterium]|jgi:formamidopyrimidine-DNA glycosylase